MSDPTSKTTELPKLNRLQWGELYRVREGKGKYWPNGRQIATLKALANRRMVTFNRGYGWSILPEADAALAVYVQENPNAF